MQFIGEIQVTRYKDTRYVKTLTATPVSISCILYLRILYLFDKPEFEIKNSFQKKGITTMSTSQRKLGYAVLGLGIGMAHADAAYASDRADLVAVCDLNEKKLAKAAKKYTGVTTYTDFEELLKDDRVECISICLPSAMHADFAVRAVEAGK